MIDGLDWSSYSTVASIERMMTEKVIVDLAFVRAWNGFQDDQEFDNVNGISYRKMLDTVKTPHGSVLWAPYMYLGYSAQVGSLNWTALGGAAQFDRMYARATNGGQTHQITPMIDIEHNSWLDENLVRHIVPIVSMDTYCTTTLVPAITRANDVLGRLPILYSNPDFILNYLGDARLKRFPIITECPLIIASYSTGPKPSYWDTTPTKKGVGAYWKTWLGWQDAGNIKDWPGISVVDHIKAQGTRAQWKAWLADKNAPMPQDGTVEPPPVVPGDPPVIPGLAEVAADVAKIKTTMVDLKAALVKGGY